MSVGAMLVVSIFAAFVSVSAAVFARRSCRRMQSIEGEIYRRLDALEDDVELWGILREMPPAAPMHVPDPTCEAQP